MWICRIERTACDGVSFIRYPVSIYLLKARKVSTSSIPTRRNRPDPSTPPFTPRRGLFPPASLLFPLSEVAFPLLFRLVAPCDRDRDRDRPLAGSDDLLGAMPDREFEM